MAMQLAGDLVKLVRNLGNINELLDTFESAQDFIKDVTPIAHQMGLDAINKMAEFERKGYIDFVRELGRVGDNIVTHFTPDDVKDLADNIVNILETVKRITQPDMLVAVNNAITVYGSLEMEKFEEYSLWKAFREMRSPEMKKGMGFMINFLKNLAKQQEMQQSINKNNIIHQTNKITMAQKTYAGVTVDVNEEGYFTNPSQWTKEIAAEIAKEEDVTLTDKHYAMLEYLRDVSQKEKHLPSGELVNQELLILKDFMSCFLGRP